MKIIQRIGITGAVVGLVGLAGVAAAAVIVKQAPCVTPDGYCVRFFAGDPIPLIRSFTFNAPSAGTASVTFHGTMVCTHHDNAIAVVDLVGQIVGSAGAVPNASGPGGSRYSIVMVESIDGTADTFNLASTRVMPVGSAGPRTVYFKLRAVRMDVNTDCIVYNAAFSVIFIP